MDLTRKDRWIEDIDMLYSELPKRHKNLFFNISRSDFKAKVEGLKSKVQDLDDMEITVNISKIVASIGDAHTSVNMPVYYLCPLEFYWFSDGIYITKTSERYQELQYGKITHINRIPIEQVIEKLSSIISHENTSFLKSLLPKYLQASEILYGLEITDDVENVAYTISGVDGIEKEYEVKFYPFKDAVQMLSSNANVVSQGNLPLYRRNEDKLYWFEYIKSFKTVYFNYKACREMEGQSVYDFGKDLLEYIERNDVEKLVIDLRNNHGGNSTILDPFIRDLKNQNKINSKGSLFVIIGRDTFSSALLNAYSLKNKTNAILVGEPSGGKPNCYGEVKRFTLKNSGLVIGYSTKFYEIIQDNDQPSLFPHVSIELTIDCYIENRDPCLEYILGCS